MPQDDKGRDTDVNTVKGSVGDVPSLRREKIQFSGGCSFIVSLLGYSMGISDYWRFPYLVYRNGGGAFLIPFAIMLLVFGIPLYFMEVLLSQFSGHGPMTIWEVSPFFKGIGITILCINLVCCINFNIIRAWIIKYFIDCFSSTLPWTSCNQTWSRPGCIPIGSKSNDVISALNVSTIVPMTPAEQYWQYEVLKLSPGIDTLGDMMWNFVLYVFIFRVIVTLCMVKSIKSIEKVMFVTLFVPMILMLVLWVRSLTLEGSVTGMMYYLTPSFDRMLGPKIWIEAAQMACYTLGPGWGAIFTIGSHNKFASSCLRHSVVTTVCDFISAFINGLICFSILGVMAHESGLDLEETVTSGLALGFTVYPTAFNYFPLPQVWSAIFFINLILVGLDGHMILSETVMNCLHGLWPRCPWFYDKKRVAVVVGMNCVIFLLALPFCTMGGMYLFQLVDWYAVAWSAIFICFIESVVFTWIYGTDRISRDMTLMLGRPFPVILRICGSIFTPFGYLFFIVMSFKRYKPPSYGSYNYPGIAEVFGWCLAVAVVLPIFVVFFMHLLKAQGTLKQKFGSIVNPGSKWQPHDVTLECSYRADKSLSKRSFLSILVYNFTGRSRRVHDTEASSTALIDINRRSDN